AGKAKKVKGGYVLSGRWPFSSGVDPSEWNMLAGLAWLDDNAPPEARVFLLQRSQYKVIDNWFAGGLRGTGSKDVEALEQFVPEHRTLSVADTKGGPTPGSEVNPGVLFQMPVFALFPYMLSGVPLGIAEGLNDDFASGSPNRSGRMTGARIAEIQSTQIRLGEATAYAHASRLVQVANCLEAQKLVVPDAKTKARYRLEGAYAVEWALRAVDVMFALSHADRRSEIHEGRGIGIGHVVADRGGIIGGVFLVGVAEKERQLQRLLGELRGGLEFDVDVRLGPLLRAERAVRSRHAVIEQHHVVLDHAKPPRFRVAARAEGVLLSLKRRSLRDVGARAVETGFLVVPECEADRSF